jgi:hypothetical protein
MPWIESQEERQGRYKRLAIAAAAAAARARMAEVRTAYLLLAESWSNLAKTDDALAFYAKAAEPEKHANNAPAASEEPASLDRIGPAQS